MPYASDYNTEYVGEGEIEIAFFSFSIFLLNEHKLHIQISQKTSFFPFNYFLVEKKIFPNNLKRLHCLNSILYETFFESTNRLNLQTVQAPPFCGNPLYILVRPPSHSKTQIFLWTPKILKLFILHSILSFKSN